MAENESKEFEDFECPRCGCEQFTIRIVFLGKGNNKIEVTCTHCILKTEVNLV